MKKYTVLFIVMCLLAHGSSFSQPKKREVDIAKAILKLEKKIDYDLSANSLGDWYNLIGIPDFLILAFFPDKPNEHTDYEYIFFHHKKYKDYLISYLQDSTKKWEYKYYVLGLLQGACLDEYLPIIPIVYAEVKKEILKNIKHQKEMEPFTSYPYIDALYLAIRQNDLSDVVIKNYKNILLRKHLKTIREDDLISEEIKSTIRHIMSGQAALDMLAYKFTAIFENQKNCSKHKKK